MLGARPAASSESYNLRDRVHMKRVVTGIEHFCERPMGGMRGKRLGLLCNPASVDGELTHARIRINQRFPGQLKALFSPQHGFFAEKQDNMVESSHQVDSLLTIPVFSLYGETRVPSAEMLSSIDVLLVDLQDAGTRVYTFVYTLSYCLQAAKKSGKKVVVLDRPNPIGGLQIEGNCLAPAYKSFVGRYPIPMRHGLTIGELALMFNHEYGIGCDLEVVPMRGWRRSMYFADTGLWWVPPSPNLPTPTTTQVYPGQVLWEGTNLSEGRGTTLPFEFFGAPYLEPPKILADIGENGIPGVVLRPIVFEPTANKWQGMPCRGFQLHITHREEYQPYQTSLRLLQEVIRHHGEMFAWKPPPYEYVYDKLPIDVIIGDGSVRHAVTDLQDINDMAERWQPGLTAFSRISKKYYLY